MNSSGKTIDVSIDFLSCETESLPGEDASITIGDLTKRFGPLAQARLLTDRWGYCDFQELSEDTKVADLLEEWRENDPQMGIVALSLFPPSHYLQSREGGVKVAGTKPPDHLREAVAALEREEMRWDEELRRKLRGRAHSPTGLLNPEHRASALSTPQSHPPKSGIKSVSGQDSAEKSSKHTSPNSVVDPQEREGVQQTPQLMSPNRGGDSKFAGKQPAEQSSAPLKRQGEGSVSRPWPTQAPIEPLPVLELTMPSVGWNQEAADLVGAKALASLTEQWSRLFALSEPLPEYTGLNFLFLEIINAAGKTQALHLTDLTEDAMLEVLCGDRPQKERYSLLELRPICGLAVCAKGVPPRASQLRHATDSTPSYLRNLPSMRDRPPSGADLTFAAELVKSYEKGALGALLQPVLALVRMASRMGFGADPLRAVRDMSVSLQALERATISSEHDGVLKGMVVESATSARLVLLVQDPLCQWECWTTTTASGPNALVSCAVLAALANGRQLADRMLQRDRIRNGPVWQAHLQCEEKRGEIRALEAEIIARHDEESEQERREAYLGTDMEEADFSAEDR